MDEEIEEVETKTIPMPPRLRSEWEALQGEVFLLHYVWNDYKKLFLDDESRMLLTGAAPGFFQVAQEVYAHWMIVGLYKITDKAQGRPRSGGIITEENLTLKRFVLPDTTQYVDDAALRQKIEMLLAKCDTELETLKVRRNKMIAHNDLPTRMATYAPTRHTLPYAVIDNTLGHIREIMNAIGLHYDDATVGYQSSTDDNDATRLLKTLKDGLRWAEKERKAPAREHQGTDQEHQDAS